MNLNVLSVDMNAILVKKLTFKIIVVWFVHIKQGIYKNNVHVGMDIMMIIQIQNV